MTSDRNAGLEPGAGGLKPFVTTPREGGRADAAAAREEAERLGLPYVERARRSRARMFEDTGARALLEVSEADAALWLAGFERPLRFHGGMGVPRSRHLARGGADSLVEACGIGPGDRVVDCTAGRCSDALVLEAAVRPGGQVVALEASGPVHAVMSRGLRRTGSTIDLIWADHLDWLRAQPDRSADVVLFDPMFRRPAGADADFEVLRAFADPRPLRPEALEQARRVARRRVLVVDGAKGTEIRRLGARDVTTRRGAARRYGVLDPSPAHGE